MIKIEKGVAEISGNQNEVMEEFIVMLSAYKHFVNKTLFPNEPDKAFKCLMTGLAIGFEEPKPFSTTSDN